MNVFIRTMADDKKHEPISIDEIRSLVREILEEDVPSNAYRGAMTPQAQGLLNVGPGKKSPPPLPNAAKPASVALPQPGALNKFKADVNMAVDAANRVKQNVDSANTKEALRWLDKMIQFAQSAKNVLGSK